MSTEKKKLSDVAQQNNAAKSRLASTMIPPPPIQRAPAKEAEPVASDPEPAASPVIEQEPAAVVTPQPIVAVVEPAPSQAVPAKQTKTRKGGQFTITDVVEPEPPKGEAYPRQIRISEKHHYMLREIAFKQRTNISHVVYNLLDLLEEANQRDQSKGGN